MAEGAKPGARMRAAHARRCARRDHQVGAGGRMSPGDRSPPSPLPCRRMPSPQHRNAARRAAWRPPSRNCWSRCNASYAEHIANVARDVPPQPGLAFHQPLIDVAWSIELGLGPLVSSHQCVGCHLCGTVDDVRLAVIVTPVVVDQAALGVQSCIGGCTRIRHHEATHQGANECRFQACILSPVRI